MRFNTYPVALPNPPRVRVEMPPLPSGIAAPACAYAWADETPHEAIARAIARRNKFRAYSLVATGTYTPEGRREYQLTLGQPTRNGQTIDREIRFWR